jgi:hypothetical protein
LVVTAVAAYLIAVGYHLAAGVALCLAGLLDGLDGSGSTDNVIESCLIAQTRTGICIRAQRKSWIVANEILPGTHANLA